MPSPESAAMEKTVSARLPPGLAGRLFCVQIAQDPSGHFDSVIHFDPIPKPWLLSRGKNQHSIKRFRYTVSVITPSPMDLQKNTPSISLQ
jgi:hypothetical protein